MNTDLAIIRKENIDVIVSSAPTAYNENTVSHDRCIDAGKSLLARMQQGMTDELDQEAATFIEKARKTVAKMKDKRSSLTKLFDEIRTTFTGMENDIDGTKSGTVPFLIQQERNRYAAKKREEELARQREEMRKQQRAQAGIKYRSECDADYMRQLHSQLNFYIDGLRGLFADVTLDNYAQRKTDIENFDINFPEDFLQTIRSAAPLPAAGLVSEEDLQNIRTASLNAIMRTFRDEFKRSLSEEKFHIIMNLLPSKKQELERAAKASAEEAERIRQQMKEREEAEAKRLEQERMERELKQRMEADMKAKQEAMGDLFDQASVSTPTYQPKTSVKKKLVPLNVEAFPEIFSLWWMKEGCSLSVDELTKMFKKQITLCEKCANKDGEFIQSEHIYYEDEVKAK